MSVAFFDFDKTLIRRNSARLWVQTELRLGNVSLATALRATALLMRYRLGSANLETGILSAIASLKGELETDVRERVQEFYRKIVRQHYRPRGLDRVRGHQDAGDSVVLLTSASQYLAEAVQIDLGLTDILCNRFEVDAEGRFTGKPAGALCFGDGKRTLAQEWLKERSYQNARTLFYTDSFSDVPFLAAVDHPVAVNPDPRLARLARKRGWKVEDWNGSRRRG
ncbi:MAG: HAD family hydrolase [Myxococcota bacterium]